MTTASASDPAAEVRASLQKVQDSIDQISHALDATLQSLPAGFDWVAAKVQSSWSAVVIRMDEFALWFADKLLYVGNPAMLWGAATGWRVHVGGPVANLVRDIDDADLAADDMWTGLGADRYTQSVPPQREAMGSISDTWVDNIASGLDLIAAGILTFWIAVGAAIVAFIVSLALAAGEAAGVVTAPLSPVTILGGVAIALSAILAALVTLLITTQNAGANFDKTTSAVQSWPTMTALG